MSYYLLSLVIISAVGTLGPWGPLGLGDPWALGPLSLGDPWALGTLGLGEPGPWGPLGPWAGRIL